MIDSVNKTKLYSSLFALYSFVLSYVLFGYYTEGDQLLYIKFYESISAYNFVGGFLLYNQIIGSQEPGYYTIIFLLNGLINKTLLFSLFNAWMGYCLGYALIKKNFLPILLFIAVPLNFYLLALYFSLERLKLSLLFFMLSYMVTNKPLRVSLLLLSISNHVQTILLFVGTQFANLFPLVKKLFRGRFNFKILGLLGALLVLCAALFVVRVHIMSKFNAYASLGGFRNFIKPTFFMLITLVYARDKKMEAVSMHFPIIIAAFFLGDMRLVIFSYFIFFYYAASVNRGLNIGIIISSLYFLLKGVLFIVSILETGSGYPAAV